MLNIVVCDDEKEALLYLKNLIVDYFSKRGIKVAVATFTEAEVCLEYCRCHKVNIIFLDVYIKQDLGSQLALDLRSINIKCPLVFVTTSKEHALDAFSVNAAHYLVKPVTEPMVADALTRCLKIIESDDEALIVQNRTEILRFQQKDIFYLEVSNKHTIIHLRDRKKLEVFNSLSELEDQLNAGNFVKCHRSFLVNMNAVEDFNKEGLVLTGGEVVPVGAPRRREVKDIYLRFVFKCLNNHDK